MSEDDTKPLKKLIKQCVPHCCILDITETTTLESVKRYSASLRCENQDPKRLRILIFQCRETNWEVFRSVENNLPLEKPSSCKCFVIMLKDTLMFGSDLSKLNRIQIQKFLEDDRDDRKCCICLEEQSGYRCSSCAVLVCDSCCKQIEEVGESPPLKMVISWCPICRDNILCGKSV